MNCKSVKSVLKPKGMRRNPHPFLIIAFRFNPQVESGVNKEALGDIILKNLCSKKRSHKSTAPAKGLGGFRERHPTRGNSPGSENNWFCSSGARGMQGSSFSTPKEVNKRCPFRRDCSGDCATRSFTSGFDLGFYQRGLKYSCISAFFSFSRLFEIADSALSVCSTKTVNFVCSINEGIYTNISLSFAP